MSQGRLYTVQVSEAESAAVDFFEINVPADAVVILHEVRITQSSDAGDAESEQIRFQIKRGVGSTSGSGGAAATFNKVQTGDAATGMTGETMNTTQAVAGGGSLTTLLEESENIHNGWLHAPPPDERFVFSPDEEIIISSPTTPADSLTWSAYILLEELGG